MTSVAYNRIVGDDVILPNIIAMAASLDFSPPPLSTATNTPLMYFMESNERYSGLDLDYYRESMTPHEFRAYIDFIGEEKLLDFAPDDFEIYYPEDEE